MKSLYVADGKAFPKLTDLPVMRCISKVLLTVTMTHCDDDEQLNEEEYSKPDSTFLKPVANGPKSLDKFVLRLLRGYHVIYEEICSRWVLGVSVRVFFCI